MKGDELPGLIHMRTDAPAVRGFLAGLGEEPVVRPDWGMMRLRYLFMSAGVVAVEATTARLLVALYLHAPGPLCADGYRGELPCGLSFSLTRAAVRQRMESPAYSGFVGSIPFDAWIAGHCMVRVAFDERDRIAFLGLLPWSGRVPSNKAGTDAIVETIGAGEAPPLKPDPGPDETKTVH